MEATHVSINRFMEEQNFFVLVKGRERKRERERERERENMDIY
jgi:hypothetical protein